MEFDTNSQVAEMFDGTLSIIDRFRARVGFPGAIFSITGFGIEEFLIVRSRWD